MQDDRMEYLVETAAAGAQKKKRESQQNNTTLQGSVSISHGLAVCLRLCTIPL